MNSLELVRKLYDGEIDIEALAKDLDEDARQELTQLLEAKAALEALPRSRPAPGVIDGVVAEAVRRKEARSTMTLILTNRMLQRLAAAAVVVVAVGVGYLTLRTDGILPVDRANAPAVSSEPTVALGQAGAKEPDEEMAEAPAESMNFADQVEQKPAPAAIAASPDEGRERDRSVFRQDFDEVGALAAAEPSSGSAGDHLPAVLGREAFLADSSLKKEGEDDSGLMTWDLEEEAFRTFFWQVRALDGRSPGEDWEEAVPLEGSFERLEKQQPGNDGLLKTRGEQ
ncbi:MAG TPA: hypothetical protein VMO47_08805 [Rhodothermales bacterium]|nr:hypothetical protein [Rhodothermales bacterium]